jgi:response regulator NasT
MVKQKSTRQGALKTALKVLLVDDSPERTDILRSALELAGYEVTATLESPLELLRAVDAHLPDIIIIDTESPSRDVLEHVVMVTRDQPRPIVMFSSDGGTDSIREAVRAGVSAYIVDGLAAGRVKGIVDVAVARFEEYQKLVAELAEANLKLSERKVVERAKGILMKSRDMTEDQAYEAMRNMAMNRKKKLAEVARMVIDMADIMG